MAIAENNYSWAQNGLSPGRNTGKSPPDFGYLRNL